MHRFDSIRLLVAAISESTQLCEAVERARRDRSPAEAPSAIRAGVLLSFGRCSCIVRILQLRNENMVTITDLRENWKPRRALLEQQLEMLESGKMRTGNSVLNSTTAQTAVRIKAWIADLDALRGKYANYAC